MRIRNIHDFLMGVLGLLFIFPTMFINIPRHSTTGSIVAALSLILVGRSVRLTEHVVIAQGAFAVIMAGVSVAAFILGGWKDTAIFLAICFAGISILFILTEWRRSRSGS